MKSRQIGKSEPRQNEKGRRITWAGVMKKVSK